MTYVSSSIDLSFVSSAPESSTAARTDPRVVMFHQLPRWLQPFLTWLTARPAPGEAAPARTPRAFVLAALIWTACGIGAGVLALHLPLWAGAPVLALGLLMTTCGLGLFQVVVFHHCAHGTVFRDRARNRQVGRLISALLLFKHFDAYQREHMLHHSPRKLLTDEDEFADFVFAMCNLRPGLAKRELWRRVLRNLFSPAFHARFLRRRVRASLASPDRAHNAVGIAVWTAAAAAGVLSGHAVAFLLVWVLPVTVLLQMATVFRILCEHRFPPPVLIAARGKEFVCRATAGVFPGQYPPAHRVVSLTGAARWAGWWLNMLTVQLFVRLFVLVGDAPCHDFHHRRPATRRWTSYIHARQQDLDAGCPGFPLNYQESWGLFRAIDENLATLSATPPEVVF